MDNDCAILGTATGFIRSDPYLDECRNSSSRERDMLADEQPSAQKCHAGSRYAVFFMNGGSMGGERDRLDHQTAEREITENSPLATLNLSARKCGMS